MSQTAVRLLSLLSLLQGNRGWTGGELAARMDVSTRTVRHDIERLRELGYAVEGTRGSDGGYRLGAGGSALPPILLDADEAIAVAVGLRTGLSCIIGGMEETSVRALTKLEQTLPSHLRLRMRNLAHYTVPLPSNQPMPIVDPSMLTMVAGLCHSRERLRFDYLGQCPGSGAMPARTMHDIEPYRLVNRQHRWFLLGYDVAASDWALFEVDRIEPKTPSGPRFTSRDLTDEDVAAYVDRLVPGITWRHQATVLLHAPAERMAGQVVSAEGRVEPVDEHSCTLRLGAETVETMALVLGRLEVDFTILDNPDLSEVVQRLAARFQRSTVPGS